MLAPSPKSKSQATEGSRGMSSQSEAESTVSRVVLWARCVAPATGPVVLIGEQHPDRYIVDVLPG